MQEIFNSWKLHFWAKQFNMKSSEKMLIDDDISFQSPSMSNAQRRDNLAIFSAFRQNTKHDQLIQENLNDGKSGINYEVTQKE